MEKTNELIIGQRYWLDSMKDVSGLYIGDSETGCPMFEEIQGNDCYEHEPDGSVRFITKNNFFLES